MIYPVSVNTKLLLHSKIPVQHYVKILSIISIYDEFFHT